MKDAAQIALRCLDLTSLNDADTAADIDALCAKAQTKFGHVAAVCVWPAFVRRARGLLPPSVKVAAVANFPDGAIDLERAVRDSAKILDAGGDEVDLVLPYRAFASGEHMQSMALVAAVRRASEGKVLKLIIESGELKDAALVRAASQLGLDAGVDFLKTSTGKTPLSATPEAAREMLRAIAVHARAGVVGFKASGGIRKVSDAAVYIALTREALGEHALTAQRLRFGASGLLTDILAVLSDSGSLENSSSAY